jgi:two-component system phosphate regulon response regulator PhoB
MIDDDPDHLIICRLGLEKAGFDFCPVSHIANLDELTQTIGRFSPDIIFVDHEMPNFKGDQVIRRLRNETLTAALPIIYFSGNDHLPELANACGADGFLRKPFYFQELVEMIKVFLNRDCHHEQRATA